MKEIIEQLGIPITIFAAKPTSKKCPKYFLQEGSWKLDYNCPSIEWNTTYNGFLFNNEVYIEISDYNYLYKISSIESEFITKKEPSELDLRKILTLLFEKIQNIENRLDNI